MLDSSLLCSSSLLIVVLFTLSTAMAVDLAKQGWMSRKEDEVNLVLESASSQLVEQFEQQKKEAVEKAVGEAQVKTAVIMLPKSFHYSPYPTCCRKALHSFFHSIIQWLFPAKLYRIPQEVFPLYFWLFPV